MTLVDALGSRLSPRATSNLRDLVVRAVALADRPDRDDELSALAARAPLGPLADVAYLHGLSGTLERSLGRVPGIPAATLDELRSDAEQDAVEGLAHLAALQTIGAEFDRQGIRWLTMKGPVLAHVFHTRPSDRSYLDLDLLVDREHFQAAAEVLEGQGYEHKIKNWRLAEEMLAGEIVMRSGSTCIDLHWHLHYSSFDRSRTTLVPDEMLARARRVELPGGCVPTFDPVDTLLNLAYHAARSHGHRLIWLKDLERALVVDQPDLEALVRRAIAADCGPQVGVMLIRTSDLLDVPVPDEIISALVPPPIRALDRAVRRFSNPVQFHERSTATRFVTRSIGRSTRATIAELPRRALHRSSGILVPGEVNETSDPTEKQRFFRAVAASGR